MRIFFGEESDFRLSVKSFTRKESETLDVKRFSLRFRLRVSFSFHISLKLHCRIPI